MIELLYILAGGLFFISLSEEEKPIVYNKIQPVNKPTSNLTGLSDFITNINNLLPTQNNNIVKQPISDNSYDKKYDDALNQILSSVEYTKYLDYIPNELTSKLIDFFMDWQEYTGSYPYISPAQGSVGRFKGNDDNSQHNIDKWGRVYAVDIMLRTPYGNPTPENMQYAYDIAKKYGFTGIGLYKDTKPFYMIHLDIRDTFQVATWSRIEGEYSNINRGLV